MHISQVVHTARSVIKYYSLPALFISKNYFPKKQQCQTIKIILLPEIIRVNSLPFQASLLSDIFLLLTPFN